MSKRTNQRRASVGAADIDFAAKQRKRTPYEFVLDALAAVSPWTRPLFGCTAIYVGEKIVLCVREKPTFPRDNGVWLATTEEHHDSLRREFPNMRSVGLFEREVTGWQVLAADSPDFESAALRACELITAADERIGKIPGQKRNTSARKTSVAKRSGKTGPGKKMRPGMKKSNGKKPRK